MKLTDILPAEKWIELERDIYERSGLASNVFDVEGIRITDFKVWVNRLCPAVKADDRGAELYLRGRAYEYRGHGKGKSRKPVVEECDAGLLKLVVPIFVKGEFLGAVGACGLLLDDAEIDSFMVSRTLEISDEKIGSLSSDIERISSKDVEALGNYITERIDGIMKDLEQRK